MFDESQANESMRAPLLSLVICSVDRRDQLIRLFSSLSSQSCRMFEAILVDQNEGNELVEVVARFRQIFPIIHLRSERGLSKARNKGLAVCTGSIVGFPDDDCWYAPDTVKSVTAIFAGDASVNAINGRTTDQQGRDSLNRYLDRSTAISKANIWNTHNSNALFFRMDTARSLGGFDERLGVGAPTRFQSGEEVDLILRAIESGTAVIYLPHLRIFHEQVDAAFGSDQLARSRRYAPGFGFLLKAHNFGAAYAAYRVLRTTASAVFALMRGDVWKMRYKAAWARGTVTGFLLAPDAAPTKSRSLAAAPGQDWS